MTDSAEIRSAFRALTISCLGFALLSDQGTVLVFADPSAAVSEQDAAKVLLEDLDGQFERLEKLHVNAPTKEEHAAAEARLATLKERRKDLRKNFDQGRYDVLKTDVAVEHARLSSYLAKPNGELAAGPATGHTADLVLPAKVESVRAASGEKITSRQIQALLGSLETDITELEKRVNQMPISSERDATKRRVQALHDRSADLANNFDKRSYDILRNDVKSEWNTVTR